MESSRAVTSGPSLPVSNGAFAMALFIASEAMFFTGLISAFVVLRAQTLDWPPAGQPRLPVVATGFSTFLLLLSGWSMFRARLMSRQGRGHSAKWLTLTAVLGASFLLLQGAEWTRMIQFGLTTTSSLYGGTFYVLVGAHGLHVVAALAALLIVRARVVRGGYSEGREDALLPMTMYWLFVVAVWPVLYALVYF